MSMALCADFPHAVHFTYGTFLMLRRTSRDKCWMSTSVRSCPSRMFWILFRKWAKDFLFTALCATQTSPSTASSLHITKLAFQTACRPMRRSGRNLDFEDWTHSRILPVKNAKNRVKLQRENRRKIGEIRWKLKFNKTATEAAYSF